MAEPGSAAEKVKQAADIVKIVGEYVPLRKAGVNMVGLCPFHSEKTPSFSVHPTRQIFHCFGCGEGGDVFQFVMMIDNVTFPEALRQLAEKTGIRLQARAFEKEADDPKAKERAALYRLHEEAGKFFAEQMSATGEGRAARAYLADRGLTGPVISRFGLGYAPSSGQALTRYLAQSRIPPGTIELSGLLIAESGTGGKSRTYDRFRRRIIFPITNERGKVIAFAGRTLGGADASGPKYLNSPETPIYYKSRVLYNLSHAGQAIRKTEYAVLVEGYMDSIALASVGIENVVASCGTSLTENQVKLLARFARRVVVNFDPDAAGVRATERSLDLLLEEGFEVKVLELPDDLDPDGFVRQKGEAAYREELGRAPSYLDYLTDRAAREHDLESPEGKVAAVNAVLPRLARIPNRILRAETARRVAESLRIEERLVREEIDRAARERRPEVKVSAPRIKDEVSLAERQLLQILLENEELRKEFVPRIEESSLHRGLATEAIFEQLLQTDPGAEVDVSGVAERLGTEQQKLLYGILASTAGSPGRDEAESSWGWLWRRHLERRLQKLPEEMAQAQRNKEMERFKRLNDDKLKLHKELAKIKKLVRFSNKSIPSGGNL